MEALKQNHNKIISLRKAKKIVIVLVFMLFFDFFLFSMPVLANEAVAEEDANISEEALIIEEEAEKIENNLPENSDIIIKNTSLHTVTAYNSDPAQTDDTPCITANGFNVCEHGIEDTVAANFLKFGTKIRMPELYGARVFIVRDRMNKRYTSRVDIWMLENADARNFGVQSVVIEVLE